jgi:hypothetical protein
LSHTVIWLHKLFHQHMKTKSALILGFSAYDVTPSNDINAVVPPAVAPTIAPAPFLKNYHAQMPTFTFPTVTSLSASKESDDEDGPPVPPLTTHAPLDMTGTNACLTPRLPHELQNLETFYNPKPGGNSNFALLNQSNAMQEDKLPAFLYNKCLSENIKTVTSNENICSNSSYLDNKKQIAAMIFFS